MMDSNKNNLANAKSLLGMLQRGRGKGYLDALEAPREVVWALLFECITHDPRIDTQCETRAEYYAGLIAATGMDLRPLQHDLQRNDAHDTDSNLWPLLTWETLVRMAMRGSSEAVRILRDYVSYGQMWDEVMDILADVDTPEALDQTVAALCHRIRNDAAVYVQFEDAVQRDWDSYCHHNEDTRTRCRFFLPICEPWRSICGRNVEFAGLFSGVGIDYDWPPPPERPSKEYLAGLSLGDLFSLVDESNRTDFRLVLPDKILASDEDFLLEQLATGDRHRMFLAFRGLGELGTPRAFEALKSYIEASEEAVGGDLRYAAQAITEMPGWLTLETARRWFRRPEHHLQYPAGSILAHHATREDAPLLIEALHLPEMHRGGDSRFPNALDALARLDGLGSVPELEQIFCQTDYSFSRYRAAKAMAATAPAEFIARYAYECLWDCHWDTRVLGCRTASLSTPRALERIQEIAADGNGGAQQAAAKRLKGL
jgi:hypothetical protein